MGSGTFVEREAAGVKGYLASEVAEDLTVEELIERMEALLSLTQEATYNWDTTHGALVYATIARSTRTYVGICKLMREGLAVQAGMLSRSIFEDVVVAHWLILNGDDPDWMVERFLRHREAIALHQRTLNKELGMIMGVPLVSAPEDLEKRAAELRKEFGFEAKRDWWDPGSKGKGRGNDVGMRKIVQRLEQVADEHKMFHPRFAGGDAAVLNKTELVVNKWLNQCIHHTTIGLPFTPTSEDEFEVPEDPLVVVGFRAAWLYSQQVYLLQEISRKDLQAVETVWMYCLGGFVKAMEGWAAEEQVLEEWDELWGGEVSEQWRWRDRLWWRLRRR